MITSIIIHVVTDTTISHPLETPTTPAALPTFGQMWSQRMTSSAHLDSTAPAPYRSSLVAVGNPIYLMFPATLSIQCIILFPLGSIFFFLHILTVTDSSGNIHFGRFYCRKGSTSQTSKPSPFVWNWNHDNLKPFGFTPSQPF